MAQNRDQEFNEPRILQHLIDTARGEGCGEVDEDKIQQLDGQGALIEKRNQLEKDNVEVLPESQQFIKIPHPFASVFQIGSTPPRAPEFGFITVPSAREMFVALVR